MAAAGILNRQSVEQAMAGSTAPMTSAGTGGSGSASADSMDISANDFLTLLVTEMQNQDPTADTDPNAYINQLVEVNSLEQLIDINQTLSTALGTPAANSSNGSAPSASAAGSPQASVSGVSSRAAQSGAAKPAGEQRAIAQAPGNLSVPAAHAAAQRVAHALNGRARAHPATQAPALP